MGRMSIRATYALDHQTDQRIRRLARLWGVSQAEVIRRSVERAAEAEAGDALTPADVVAHYADQPPARSKARTRQIIESLRRLRADDDAHRTSSP
jgi:hypothetical protein